MADKNFPRRPGDRSTRSPENDESTVSPDAFHTKIYRHIDDFFTSFDMLNLSVFEDTWKYIPSVNIMNDKEKIIITAEIPGLTASDIEVTLRSDALMIYGGRKNPDDPSPNPLGLDAEIPGFFRKTIPLPSCIEAAKIRATYKNGVLRIMLPKCSDKSDSRLRIPVRRSGRIT